MLKAFCWVGIGRGTGGWKYSPPAILQLPSHHWPSLSSHVWVGSLQLQPKKATPSGWVSVTAHMFTPSLNPGLVPPCVPQSWKLRVASPVAICFSTTASVFEVPSEIPVIFSWPPPALDHDTSQTLMFPSALNLPNTRALGT